MFGSIALLLLLISSDTEPVTVRPSGSGPRSGAPRLALTAMYCVMLGGVSLTINKASVMFWKLTPPKDAVSTFTPTARYSASVSWCVVAGSVGSVTAKSSFAFTSVNVPSRVTSPSNVASTLPVALNSIVSVRSPRLVPFRAFTASARSSPVLSKVLQSILFGVVPVLLSVSVA